MTHIAQVSANVTAILAAATIKSSSKKAPTRSLPYQNGSAQATLEQTSSLPVQRRNIVNCALIGGLVLAVNVVDQSALAAGKRGPAPPPKEKNDPNVSGVLAKVLASKRRKEAMKEAMARQRESGKPVSEK